MSRIVPLALLACLLPLQALPADAPADERTATYERYRSAFDAREYQAALPLATRVVELTANQYGEEAVELVNPLTNLATTLYRLGQHGEALDTYRRALTILELSASPADARLVTPLHGIGMTLRALERWDEAIVPLKRAVDIIRNREGLYSSTQLAVLKPLIECYEKTWRREDAQREHQYAFNVAEQAFGADDPRMIEPLGIFAGWYEKTGRYAAARVLHVRAVQLADREQPNSIKAVNALRGIARTYRLAFVNGETQDAMMSALNELPPSLAASAGAMSMPSSEGERSLRNALARLESAGASKAAERGEVLLDLGDWYRVAGANQRAMSSWADAWKELAKAGDTSALEKPAAIVYRAPSIAVSTRPQDPNQYTVHEVQLRVSVSADGAVREVTTANPVPARESAERAVTTAVRRATWRPAFAGGMPVAAPDHLFTEQVYVKIGD